MMMEEDYNRRFSSLARLYGDEGLQKLENAHVIVAGIGGVGSWAAEALARTGVGELTLIDLDNVAESNINRQLHSLTSTLGAPKIEVMAERIANINARCKVHCVEDFLTLENIPSIIQFSEGKTGWILDAIDEVRVKAALIAHARFNKLKIITTGAAGGKTIPTDLMIDDLNNSFHDALCAKLKSYLKKEYGFPSKPKKMNVPVVFSQENSTTKTAAGGLNCSGYGSVVTMTATMGMMAAGFVINKIVEA